MNDAWWFRSDSGAVGLWLPRSVELSLEAEADILLAYQAAYERFDSEVSGFAHVEPRDDFSFFASGEVVIYPQECSGGGTEIHGDSVFHAFNRLREQGKDPAEYLWWHSHVKGPARFSFIDDDMIERHLDTLLESVHREIVERGEKLPDETMAGPFLSLVGNVYGEMTIRCDFVHRYRGHRRYIPLSPYILVRHFPELSEGERRDFLASRSEAVTRLVRERVTLIRVELSDLLRERKGWLRLFGEDDDEDYGRLR